MVKGIYIAEPRWVNLCYFMTDEEFHRCIGLVSQLQPPLGDSPLMTVLAGRLEQSIIDSRKVHYRPLSENERHLLMQCIKPVNGSREYSIKHAKLVALDYLTTMRVRCDHFDAYVNEACLDKLESPINLKVHYHDELIARTFEELEEFRAIMRPCARGSQTDDRTTRLRDWYSKALARKTEEFGGKSPLKELSYDHLFSKIRNHDQTIFFGSASMTVLQELLEKEPSLGKKVRYFQQGGTFNSKLNILGNPYNFALNTAAAKYVFRNQHKLEKFTLIPTDTTKKIEWRIEGLAHFSPAVGVRSLAYHGKYDPWEIVSPEEASGMSHTTRKFLAWRAEWTSDPLYSTPNSKGYKAVMADLTAFLAAFTEVFRDIPSLWGSLKQSSVKVTAEELINGSDQMILREDEKSSIECLMLEISDGHDVLVVKDASRLLESALKTASPFG